MSTIARPVASDPRDLVAITAAIGDHICGWRFRRARALRDLYVAGIRREFARFARNYPFAAVMQQAAELEQRTPSDDVELLLAKLEAAITRESGFSFLRMGDGEGRFVGPARSFKYFLLHDQARLIAADIWYKYSQPPPTRFYAAVARAYQHASIVGYVPRFRLELEAKNVWYGYFGCVCGNEFIRSQQRTHESLVRNWTHVHSAEDPRFAGLLRRTRVAFVTCHAQKERFERALGLANSELVLIPPQGHPLLENLSGATRLYPERFHEILRGFASSNAQVYLVGAGIFAKIFCEQLRKLGKVGIDIGSVLDDIAGIATRPRLGASNAT